MSDLYYGKYRGVVADNNDPQQQGRIQATVPAVPGQAPSGWATACTPFVGILSGLAVLPAIGDNVWIEFEGGDPNSPVWTGGFWPQMPAPNDGVMLRSSTGAMIEISGGTVSVSNGSGASISLAGPVVSVNNGGLEVT